MTEPDRDILPQAAGLGKGPGEGPGTGEAGTRPPLATPASAGGRLRQALRCRGGFTAVEFAVAAIPAILLLGACIETGWQMATAAALDYGAARAGRFAVTGANTVGGAAGAPACRSQAIPWMVSYATGGFLHQDRLTYAAKSYANYAAASTGQGGASGAGTGGQTVSYTLTYKQPYLFPEIVKFLLPHLVTEGSYREYSTTFLAKNEPFTDAACYRAGLGALGRIRRHKLAQAASDAPPSSRWPKPAL